jgi:hypothetical protein
VRPTCRCYYVNRERSSFQRNRLYFEPRPSDQMAYCDRCERRFPSERALEQHKDNSNAHWLCDDCDLDFGSFYGRQEHYKQSRNHHYCKECDRLFNFEESKIQHMEAKHWYCRAHDRVRNSSAKINTWASNEKLMPSYYTVDFQVRSRPAIALQTKLRSPHLPNVWVRP